MQFRSSEVISFFFPDPVFFYLIPCKQQYCWNFAFKTWFLRWQIDVQRFCQQFFLKLPKKNTNTYQISGITMFHEPFQRCVTNVAVRPSRQQEPPPSWRTRWPARRSASQHFFGQSRACLLRRHLKRYDVQALKRSGEKGRCWAGDWNLGRVTILIKLWQTSWSRIKVYIPGTQMTFKVDIYLNQSAFPNAWLCWTKKTWWPNMDGARLSCLPYERRIYRNHIRPFISFYLLHQWQSKKEAQHICFRSV